jgi:predicted TIM-barrel fold metal-dependent hydrolase
MEKVIRGVPQANGSIMFTGMSTGNSYKLMVDGYTQSKKVNVVIDGHSHIQSGATAPLPLLWNQMANVRLTRTYIDSAGSVFLGKGGNIQRLKTEEIAEILVSELSAAYKDSKLLEDEPYRRGVSKQEMGEELFGVRTYIFSPVIIMPMDMDFAHIAGFPPECTTIYHVGTFDKWISAAYASPYPGAMADQPTKITVDGVYYYNRNEAPASENKGVLVDVSHERPNQVWVHQRYKAQIDATIVAVKKNPWQIIPMFHYDPRRWCKESGADFDDKKWASGTWDEPFKYIATLKTAGVFIGFKMYPPLGYKPLDPRLPNLEKFYARCEAEGIPILTHCSPGGMTTHEAKFYHALDKADLTQLPARIVSCSYDPCTPLGYFFDNYVHPRNWRPVLMKYPKLKLCLAHFGGAEWDEIGLASDWVEEITNLCDPKIVQGHNAKGEIRFENVYTDMSCYNLEKSSVKKNVMELLGEMKSSNRYRHLQDKVIFGVDWYLSLITKAPGYREYAESFFDTMKEYDKWQWYKSSLVNSSVFYGLDKKDIINNMQMALMNENKRENEEAKKKLQYNYSRILSIQKQIENLRSDFKKSL